jgi:hypothetical protein
MKQEILYISIWEKMEMDQRYLRMREILINGMLYGRGNYRQEHERFRENARTDPIGNLPELRRLYTDGNDPMAFIIGAIYDEAWLATYAWFTPWLVKWHILRGEALTPENLRNCDPGDFPRGPRGKRVGEAIVGTAERLERAEEVTRLFMTSDAYEIQKKLDENLDQIGLKKARMLTRDFAIWADPRYSRLREIWGWSWAEPFAREWGRNFSRLENLDQIHIPPDVHAEEVIGKVEGIQKVRGKDIKEFGSRVYREFPALVDSPLWYIGREFCKGGREKCEECPLDGVCNYSLQEGSNTAPGARTRQA